MTKLKKFPWWILMLLLICIGFIFRETIVVPAINIVCKPLSRTYVSSYLLNERRKASPELRAQLTRSQMQKFLGGQEYKWMREQVRADLAHHTSLSQEALNTAFDVNNIPNNKLVRIRIKNSDVYVRKPFDLFLKSWTKVDRSLVVILNVLEDLCAQGLLPDVDFILSCQDCPKKTTPGDMKTYPIFAFSKNIEDSYEKGLILVPDFENIIVGRTQIPELYNTHSRVDALHEKKSQILFRGGDSDVTGFRHRVVEYARDKDFIDAEIVMHNRNQEKSMSIPQQVAYKYNISADGVTATWTRVAWLLATDTLMIKHRSPRYQWFYGGMKPNIHYIEVGDDINELQRVFSALEENPQRAKQIVANGRAFYRNNLQMPAIYGYIFVLLDAYHHKQQAMGYQVTLDDKDNHYGLWKREVVMTKPEAIYKLLTHEEWADFQETGIFEGSEFDKKSGFIHMSYKGQIAGISAKFFKGKSDVVLLRIDLNKLDPDSLRPVANKPGGNIYPHLYGRIPMAAVTKTEALS